MAGLIEDVTGAADHLAGSTDEAVGRTFDDEEGGGVYEGTAGVLDHLAGSTDEAVGRQFDDEEGGGFADPGAGAAVADDFAGSTDEWVGRNTGNLLFLVAIVFVFLYLAGEVTSVT